MKKRWISIIKIELEDFAIDCEIQYGKRKHIYINIDTSGFVTIKVPNNTSEETIVGVVKKNEKKIKSKLDEIAQIRAGFGEKTYDQSGKFLYLGKEYSLDELIQIEGLTQEEMQINLKKFYIKKCKELAKERIKLYEKQLGVKPKTIEVDESKSRWGSCSSKKDITFNYRLIMAPIESFDYVVVHELCHLKHMNHDRSFWRLVGSIFPNYKERQKYLNKYGAFLTL